MAKELQPGSYFRFEGKGFEYKGIQKTFGGEQVVARINAEEPEGVGSLHRIFTPQELEQSAVKVGPFREGFPYSIYAQELQAWQQLMGNESIDIPFPPERLIGVLMSSKEMGFHNFEPHYFPAAKFKKDRIEIGRKKIRYPNDWIMFNFDGLTRHGAPRDFNVDEGWILIDGGQPPFENDQLPNLLGTVSMDTRYGLNSMEINGVICLAMEETLKLDDGEVRMPTLMEFMTVVNMFHKDWLNASHGERFDDTFTVRLSGDTFPASFAGGKQRYSEDASSEFYFVSIQPTTSVDEKLGFRPMIVLNKV